MFFGILNEIDIKDKSDYTFLKFEDLNKEKLFGENNEELFKTFEGVYQLNRRTRLKVNEGWTDKLMELIQSEKMIDLHDESTKEIENLQLKEIDGGVLMNGEKAVPVIKINDIWYEIPINKKPIELFKQIIDERLAKYIWYKIKRYIIILKSVTSWKDTENRYEPIKIIMNKHEPDTNI